MPGNAYLGIEYGLFAHLDTTTAKNDEVAALKWLQFRSGSGQLRV